LRKIPALRSIRCAPVPAAAAYQETDGTGLAGIQARASHRGNRNGTPVLVGKIKIEPAGMLSDADIRLEKAIGSTADTWLRMQMN